MIQYDPDREHVSLFFWMTGIQIERRKEMILCQSAQEETPQLQVGPSRNIRFYSQHYTI